MQETKSVATFPENSVICIKAISPSSQFMKTFLERTVARVTFTSVVLPPLRTVRVTLVPSSPLTAFMQSPYVSSVTTVPFTAVTTSFSLMPAASAGESGITLLIYMPGVSTS